MLKNNRCNKIAMNTATYKLTKQTFVIYHVYLNILLNFA
ncbi:hypothetical protein SAMN05421780_101296 [Flexibacter flexilis DSM 6793]|uniref:Uncharacterized protein n=1 Tax=Flexibacter flexilis DSM 6793 TaxID=927664 RepID=A0A1I1DS95_9BACT|nr:hypothetical protein SAMN05421780_101296 [Flexibacter flexilis DSM 6793]